MRVGCDPAVSFLETERAIVATIVVVRVNMKNLFA